MAHAPRKAQIVKGPQGFWKNQLIHPGQNPHFPFLMCEALGDLIACLANDAPGTAGRNGPDACSPRTRSNGRPRESGAARPIVSYIIICTSKIANIIRDDCIRFRNATSGLREASITFEANHVLQICRPWKRTAANMLKNAAVSNWSV